MKGGVRTVVEEDPTASVTSPSSGIGTWKGSV
jgi:hypothetical protein